MEDPKTTENLDGAKDAGTEESQDGAKLEDPQLKKVRGGLDLHVGQGATESKLNAYSPVKKPTAHK